MVGHKALFVFLAFSLAVVFVSSRGSVQGPGHHKGLYGITRKSKLKTVVVNKNSTSNATFSSISPLKSTKKNNSHSEKINRKVVKRAMLKLRNSDMEKGVLSRRTNVELLGGVIKPISLKEAEVGYSRSMKDVGNSTQVIETAENISSAKSAFENGTVSDVNSPRSASSNMLTDVNVPKLNQATDGSNNTNSFLAVGQRLAQEGGGATDHQIGARTPSSNIITDLKVPKMGQYIHGSDSSGSNGTNVTQSSAGNVTAESDNSVTSRSPQVPNFGASIVGIADSSNISQFSNRGALSHNAVGEGVKQASSEGDSMQLKAFLADLDEISHFAEGAAGFSNNTLQNVSIPEQNQTSFDATNSSVASQKNVRGNKKHEIIGPHYYEPECDDKKKCPDGYYCRMYVCVHCHRSKHACTHREQCCNDMECVYGRCEAKPKGSPGAFCEKDGECAGEACCVLEPTVDEEHSICKPKLSEFHQCSPILFRKIWIGDNKPDCGPCKSGLQCAQRGVEGSHEVCMKKP